MSSATVPLRALHEAGLDDSAIARLVVLRRQVEAERREEERLHHRMEFVKYLVEAERIHD